MRRRRGGRGSGTRGCVSGVACPVFVCVVDEREGEGGKRKRTIVEVAVEGRRVVVVVDVDVDVGGACE